MELTKGCGDGCMELVKGCADGWVSGNLRRRVLFSCCIMIGCIKYLIFTVHLPLVPRCLTCRVSDADTVCESCIRKCHKGHNVEFIRFDK